MEAAKDELTIDELAQRSGMTVRNIRAHQSRGLLPPPEVRGRTGYYDSEHLARIELIKELQADGFNLDLIRRLVNSTDGSSEEILRVKRVLDEPFGDEQPEPITAADLAKRFGTAEAEALRRAMKLGLIRHLGGDSFELISPRLARIGVDLLELGIPIEHSLDAFERLRHSSDSVAKTFVMLFVKEIWEPFDKAGRPDERWQEMGDSIERLRPLAAEALMASFQIAMAEAVEKAFERYIGGEQRGGRRKR